MNYSGFLITEVIHWVKLDTSNNNSVDAVGAGGPDVLGLTGYTVKTVVE